MKFYSLKEIRWDIVRDRVKEPWVLLGAPFFIVTGKNDKLIDIYKKPANETGLSTRPSYLAIGNPFSSSKATIETDDGQEESIRIYNVIKFMWVKWFWFWRES